MNEVNGSRERDAKCVLHVELIPASMWGKNVRAVISRENWDGLRFAFNATNIPPPFFKLRHLRSLPWATTPGCSVCGAEGESLELHEYWDFDDVKRVQKLTDLVPLCRDCHLTMHIGRANQLGLGERATRHLAGVNGWTLERAAEHVAIAMETWKERSCHDYVLDVSRLEDWLPGSHIHPAWLESRRMRIGDHLDAVAWARGILASDALVVDTETTGLLKNSRMEVIELAAINMKGKTVYSSRFKPRTRVPKRVVEIHGITTEDLADEPTFDEEYGRIFETLNSKVVISYNSKFDQGAIARTCKRYKRDVPDCRWECAMWAYKTFTGATRFLPLPNATHSALADCRAALDVIKLIAKG